MVTADRPVAAATADRLVAGVIHLEVHPAAVIRLEVHPAAAIHLEVVVRLPAATDRLATRRPVALRLATVSRNKGTAAIHLEVRQVLRPVVLRGRRRRARP